MKIAQFIILMLVLTALLAGCVTIEKAGSSEEKGAEDKKTETETGISDVFEDTEEINPPEIPG